MRKKIIFIASLITLVVLTLNLLLREGLFSDLFKSYLISKFEQETHASVTVRNVRLNFFPPFLTADEFAIKENKESLRPLLRADQVVIAFSPFSLISESVIFHKIQIQDPVVYLIWEEDGTTNFDFLTKLMSPGKKLPYIVQKLSVTNGLLDIRQKSNKSHLVIPSFEMKAEADPTMTSFQLTGASKEIFFESSQQQSVFLTSSEWKLGANQNHVDIKRINVISKEGSLSLNGIVNLVPLQGLYPFQINTDFHVSVKNKSFPFSGFSGHGKMIGGFQRDKETSGNVKFSQLVLERGKVSQEIGELNAHFAYRSRILQVDRFSGDLFGGQLEGSLLLNGEKKTTELESEYVIRRLSLENFPLVSSSQRKKYLEGQFLDATGTIKLKNLDFKLIESSGHLHFSRNGALKTDSKIPFMENMMRSLASGESDYHVNSSSLNFQNVTLRTGNTILQGDGTFQKGGSLRSRFSIKTGAGGEILTWLGYPQWTGTGEFNGEAGGTLLSPILEGKGQVKDVSFVNHSLGSGSAELKYSEGELAFSKIQILKDDGKYIGEGSVRWEAPEKFKYHVTAHAIHGKPNDIISIFVDHVSLNTFGSGPVTLTGDEKSIHLTGKIDLESGTIYQAEFENGHVNFDLNENEITFTDTTLSVHNSTVSGNGKISFIGSFLGEIRTANLNLEDISLLSSRFPGVSGTFKGIIQGNGTFDHPIIRLNGILPELAYNHQALKDGTLELVLKDNTLRTDLRFKEHPVTMIGSTLLSPPYRSTFEVQGEDFPIIPLLASTSGLQVTSLTGTLSGRVAIDGPLIEPQQLNYTVSLNRLEADVAGYPVTNRGDLVFQFKNGTLNIDSFHLKGESTSLSITGGLQLSGQINVFVTGEADLSLLKAFFKEITSGKGIAYLALNISNSWTDPRFQGGLTVQEGLIRTSFFPQPIHIASMGLFFNERQILLESFEAALGEGNVQVTGKIDLNRFKMGHFGIILETADSQFNVLPGWNSTLSGTLIYQGDLSVQTLQGEMTLSHGVYSKKFDLKPLLKKLTEIREDRKQPIPVIGNTRLNIHLLGEEDLRINNNVARLPFTADLTLKGTVDHPELIGRMESESGFIQFYNKTFTVNSISVDFIDPEDIKPLIDLKARTQIAGKEKTYQIDLGLSGTLEELNRTLTADDPALTETDILSLILAGKKATEVATDPASQQQIGGSFVPLVIESPFEGLLEELTGVNRLSIEPVSPGIRSAGGPRVTVEEHLLNDKLLLNYSYIINPTQDQVIQMDYLLNRHFYLQGIRNEEGSLGGNLKFRFEFK
ncbi:MAG: translocation/assembly module TamB domain-containing protein [Nitrospirae bacterium]|nr:translocation/assembly module TamB domain-containing protein [Nitrospirota bacterium]